MIDDPNYVFDEGKYLQQIKEYVDKTYGQHYAQRSFQSTEVIVANGHGTGFCLGNVEKYCQRYGVKNGPAEWRKDIMKIIHYSIIQLYVHDQEHGDWMETKE